MWSNLGGSVVEGANRNAVLVLLLLIHVQVHVVRNGAVHVLVLQKKERKIKILNNYNFFSLLFMR